MAFTWSRGFVASGTTKHLGVDLGAPLGQPIFAVHGGRVIYAADSRADPSAPWYTYGTNGLHGAGGNMVSIDVGGGRLELYAHQSAIAVRAGQSVAAGQRVGSVGATGYAFGSHLHFGVLDGRTFLDPLSIITRAQLIDAVSGRAIAPASGAVLVSTGGRTPQQTIDALTALGIPTDPAHHITAAEAARIVDSFPDPLLGQLRDDAIRTYSSMTVQQLIDAWTTGKVLNTSPDPITAVANAIAGIPAALVGLVWLVAILGVIILGLYVTLGSSSQEG